MGKNLKQVNADDGDGDFWVFGYGSLMWNPGFPFAEDVPAKIYGFHRCLCVVSTSYRGTPEKPGLVLGLDHGGSTHGRAFRVRADDVNHVLEYLEDREQITKVYCPHFACAHLADGRRVRAYTFIVRHEHEQYAGRLGREQCARMIATAKGDRGSAMEYMENTVAHLDQLGIGDTELHRVLKLAKSLRDAD